MENDKTTVKVPALNEKVTEQVEILDQIMASALADVAAERFAQIEKWGDQTGLTFGTTGTYEDLQRSYDARRACERAFAAGDGNYRAIITEEFWEVMAATSRDNLREELVQLAAVAVAAVEALDKQGRS